MSKLYKLLSASLKYSFLIAICSLGLSLANASAQCLSGGSSAETNQFASGSNCTYFLSVTFTADASVTAVGINVSSGTVSPTSFIPTAGSNTVMIQISQPCASPLPDIILTGFSSSGMCGTLTIPYDSALPVDLTSFTGSAEDDVVVLKWTTASEYNTDEFILERSHNGLSDFQVIKRQQAVGFTESAQEYQLVDPFPLPLAYYRLRIVDFDGTYEFSDVIVISQASWEVKALRVGPNPIGKSDLRISFEKQGKAPANAILVNSQGQIVWQQNDIIGEGMLFLTAQINHLPNGLYHLAIRQGKAVVASEKIIKLDDY